MICIAHAVHLVVNLELLKGKSSRSTKVIKAVVATGTDIQDAMNKCLCEKVDDFVAVTESGYTDLKTLRLNFGVYLRTSKEHPPIENSSGRRNYAFTDNR